MADKDHVGLAIKTDFLGAPIKEGSYIVYPSEVKGEDFRRTTKEMTFAKVVELHENGLVVDVIRRSRSGAPRPPLRTRVHLTDVAFGYLTVLELIPREIVYG